MSDRVDRRLQVYAERWRETVPVATLDPASLGLRRKPRWLAPAVVAAVVAIVVGAGSLAARDVGRDRPSRAPSPTDLVDGMVPFVALPPTHPQIGEITVPASPDPAPAKAAPPCAAGDLAATSRGGAAAGTAYLAVTFSPANDTVSCHLSGHPSVTLLDGGRPTEVVTEPEADTSETYRDPVLVGPGDTAKLLLAWGSMWCTTPVRNDKVRIGIGDGAVEVDGFGGSPGCNGPDPDAGPNTVQVGSFEPSDWTPPEVTSAFADLDASLRLLDPLTPGARVRFAVTLTARERDLRLDRCPDYYVYQVPSSGPSQDRYGLNCAGVPYRDDSGTPYLPKGVPVTFLMELTYQAVQEKAGWVLDAAGAPSLGIFESPSPTTSPAGTDSPDPARAKQAAPCSAADLRVVEGGEGATGNLILYPQFRLVGDAPCRLDPHPKVEFLHGDSVIDVEQVRGKYFDYDYPVLVAPHEPATMNLLLGHYGCDHEFPNDTIRVWLPTGESLTFSGFGSTWCLPEYAGITPQVSVGAVHPYRG
jgi:Domain of unknown function (DUF4232)